MSRILTWRRGRDSNPHVSPQAEALAALDGLRGELAMSMDADEGYGLPLREVATAAGLDPERAARMVDAHLHACADAHKVSG